MLKHKRLNQRGKLSLSKFFQKFQEGDSVAVVRDLTVPFGYNNRVQGRTGKVIEKRGSAYAVEIKDLGSPKVYLLNAIHLKKIQDVKK
jgi:large subunit ribosomal protein L21e